MPRERGLAENGKAKGREEEWFSRLACGRRCRIGGGIRRRRRRRRESGESSRRDGALAPRPVLGQIWLRC